MGVTGSGKTFTLANIIEKTQKNVLILSQNKPLAAQLYKASIINRNDVIVFASVSAIYSPGNPEDFPTLAFFAINYPINSLSSRERRASSLTASFAILIVLASTLSNILMTVTSEIFLLLTPELKNH